MKTTSGSISVHSKEALEVEFLLMSLLPDTGTSLYIDRSFPLLRRSSRRNIVFRDEANATSSPIRASSSSIRASFTCPTCILSFPSAPSVHNTSIHLPSASEASKRSSLFRYPLPAFFLILRPRLGTRNIKPISMKEHNLLRFLTCDKGDFLSIEKALSIRNHL
ncbi:hypothetical protein T459_35028 [Capsicum annuum]|uniref:Uncharacterized protein n=2 Tax=Capsicum annuum TaxID=4072 RepID=A0A075VWG0_CAPAN|nr:hypothetical protein [Capsicum annuum]AIG89827.1 hypothetical protein [Capsicum annuum]AIG90152.1 hypothetical protein [Capsicum annuum]PHT61121.1 hypothetical protein T459_35028 [Capsicum annuum]QFV19641.1 hypothetical protein [Capsicum annuum var. glabriusculum]